MSKYLEGESPEEIASDHGLSARTVGKQIRSGCRKLGFGDRRKLSGRWSLGRGFTLARLPEEKA